MDSADRSVLAEESINSIVATLSNMNPVERAGLYVGLIRFMGIFWADIMRAITIMENQDDMESLLQTRLEPHHGQRLTGADMEATAMVQTFARTRPVTLFASKALQLQAHLDSMEVDKAARIVASMQQWLTQWRQRWQMAAVSVSRDRVERLCAVLAAYEQEECGERVAEAANAEELEWARTQWNLLTPYMEADATAVCVEGETVMNETLPSTQMGGASGSGDVMVRRRPDGPLEEATAAELEEMKQHDEDDRQVLLSQQEHDRWLWDTIEEQKRQEERAKRHQQWEDWAVKSEMDENSRHRAVKRFRLQVVVVDKEGNELATTDLQGPVGESEVPQVNFVLSMETVPETEQQQAAQQQAALAEEDGRAEAMPPSDAETVPVHVPEPLLEMEVTALEDIVSSTLYREWFRLWCANQIDDEMVIGKWGKQVLDTFEINRAMVEMGEASQVDKLLMEAESEKESANDDEGNNAGSAAGSSDSGGDSNAGFSDANLGSRWRMEPGTALRVQDEGHGVGWEGLQGEGPVRQWQWPKPEVKPEEANALPETEREPSQVDPEETQLMDVEGVSTADAGELAVAEPGAENADVEGGAARATSSTEGQKGQLDLKHWLK